MGPHGHLPTEPVHTRLLGHFTRKSRFHTLFGEADNLATEVWMLARQFRAAGTFQEAQLCPDLLEWPLCLLSSPCPCWRPLHLLIRLPGPPGVVILHPHSISSGMTCPRNFAYITPVNSKILADQRPTGFLFCSLASMKQGCSDTLKGSNKWADTRCVPCVPVTMPGTTRARRVL